MWFGVVKLHVIVFIRLLDTCIYGFTASSFVRFPAASDHSFVKIHSFVFIRIYFIRISRLKFAKF